jgi:hypothetical protein
VSGGPYSKACQVGGHGEVVGGCGRQLPNFLERTLGKSWAEKVGQNKKLGSTGRGERKKKENRAEKRKH